MSTPSSTSVPLALLLLFAAACGRGPDPKQLPAVGAFASDPSVSVDAKGRVDLAIIGNDGVVWKSACDRAPCNSAAKFANFTRELGAPPPGAMSAPSLTAWSEDRLDVFVLGGDKAIWHQTWDRSYWLGWESLGGKFVSAPAAVSWGKGRLDVFAVSKQGVLEHTFCQALGIPGCRGSNWYAWLQELGRPPHGMKGDPSAVAAPGELIDVVVLGKDGVPYHRGWERGWSGWQALGGKFVHAPAIAKRGNHLDVFGVDQRGKLWIAQANNRRFRPFKETDLLLGSKPAAYSVGSSTAVVYRDPEGPALHTLNCDSKGHCSQD